MYDTHNIIQYLCIKWWYQWLKVYIGFDFTLRYFLFKQCMYIQFWWPIKSYRISFNVALQKILMLVPILTSNFYSFIFVCFLQYLDILYIHNNIIILKTCHCVYHYRTDIENSQETAACAAAILKKRNFLKMSHKRKPICMRIWVK